MRRRVMLSEKKMKEEKARSRKIKAPFSGMPSFIACAVVLSYVGFEDEVMHLLKQLCLNTSSYAILHKSQINGFLARWMPEFN